MVVISWTKEAENWIKDIYDYISKDNPLIAKKVINDIYNKAQILKTFLRAGYIYKNQNDKEIRILLYGHYRIAYLIKDETQVDILGVFHERLAIEKYLNNI